METDRSNVINISDYRDVWKEIFVNVDHADLHVFMNHRSGEVEIFQMCDGKGIRTCLSTVESIALIEALKAGLTAVTAK